MKYLVEYWDEESKPRVREIELDVSKEWIQNDVERLKPLIASMLNPKPKNLSQYERCATKKESRI